MTQQEFLNGVKKQQSLIRKLLASKKRRNEVMTELARERFASLIGKFFDTGNEDWYQTPKHTVCRISDVKALTQNVFDDQVKLHLVCKVITPREEQGKMVNLNCHTETFTFDVTEDLMQTLAGKFVGWQVADEWLHRLYEKMRQGYGLGYDRLTIAEDRIKSLEAALSIKEQAVREGLIKKSEDFFENDLCCYIGAQDFTIDHERLAKDFRKAMEED